MLIFKIAKVYKYYICRVLLDFEVSEMAFFRGCE